jgi:lysophospholipase L1-like esterase
MRAWLWLIMLPVCCIVAWTADAEQDRTMSSKPAGSVVILGASYAKGWNPGTLGAHECLNRGVDGEQSHQMRARFERDVLAHRPRSVIIWGYINDIHRSERDRIAETKERAKQSFVEMIELARANGIEPIVATELTIRSRDSWTELIAGLIGRLLGKESYQDYINSQVLELNDWLKQYAAENGIFVLDLQPVLSDGYGRRRREYATEDGSHVTQAGYEALTSRFGGILEAHLNRE